VIGHVHLRTSNIDRPRSFYVDLLGFDVVFEARDVPGWGTNGDILFVAAGGYHHHLGFNTWKSGGGPPQPDGVAGLHHVALRFSSRAALADVLLRLREVGWPIRQATDHGTHLAAYISPGGSWSEALRPGAGRYPLGRVVRWLDREPRRGRERDPDTKSEVAAGGSFQEGL
jgi:catechol-2,3-dioxygenase